MELVRVGHHSTSDDSFAYRAKSEVEHRKKVDNPINRLRLFLEARKWWVCGRRGAVASATQEGGPRSIQESRRPERFELQELFNDVYGGEEPWNLVSVYNTLGLPNKAHNCPQKEQREELGRLMKKYGDVWEPWRKEREKFKGAGKEFL